MCKSKNPQFVSHYIRNQGRFLSSKRSSIQWKEECVRGMCWNVTTFQSPAVTDLNAHRSVRGCATAQDLYKNLQAQPTKAAAIKIEKWVLIWAKSLVRSAIELNQRLRSDNQVTKRAWSSMPKPGCREKRELNTLSHQQPILQNKISCF